MKHFLCPWPRILPTPHPGPLTSDGAAPIVTRNPGQSDGRSRGFGDSETWLVWGNCEGRVSSPHHKGLTSDDGGQGCPLAASPTPAHSPLYPSCLLSHVARLIHGGSFSLVAGLFYLTTPLSPSFSLSLCLDGIPPAWPSLSPPEPRPPRRVSRLKAPPTPQGLTSQAPPTSQGLTSQSPAHLAGSHLSKPRPPRRVSPCTRRLTMMVSKPPVLVAVQV